MVTSTKTTAWGGKHGSLSLVLDKDDHRTVARDSSATINRIPKPSPVSKAITAFSTPLETLNLQESQKVKREKYELQEAATDIRVKRIVKCIKEQYVEEINEEYFGFANSTIIIMLTHLQSTW